MEGQMRAMVRTDHFITDEELSRIGEDNPGWRVERIDGGVVMSPTSYRTGPVQAQVTFVLATWARAHGYVAFAPDTGVTLARRDVLAHDGALLSLERYRAAKAAGETDGYAPVVPDVVVEVASPSDSRRRLREKCKRWHDEGAGFVVMIDPEVPSFHTWGTAPPQMDIDWRAVAAYDPDPV